MRVSSFEEKRRSKRIDLSLPVSVKCASKSGKGDTLEGITINVSYYGAYLVDISIKNLKAEDTLNISLSVPRDESRDFPFSRITGKAKVVRVDNDGIALEFGEDMSRLFVAN